MTSLFGIILQIIYTHNFLLRSTIFVKINLLTRLLKTQYITSVIRLFCIISETIIINKINLSMVYSFNFGIFTSQDPTKSYINSKLMLLIEADAVQGTFTDLLLFCKKG